MNPGSYSRQLAAVALAVPSLAFAALGGDLSSVQADQVHMKATVRIARSEAQYTVQEIQTPSGTAVREYVAANGTVFGVAWKGPAVPNLKQVLGQYFDSYTEAAKNKRSGHSQLMVQQSGLVVHSSGHMRAFFGNAYIPQMLPQGVTAKDIF
jgi:hypothetical protein